MFDNSSSFAIICSLIKYDKLTLKPKTPHYYSRPKDITPHSLHRPHTPSSNYLKSIVYHFHTGSGSSNLNNLLLFLYFIWTIKFNCYYPRPRVWNWVRGYHYSCSKHFDDDGMGMGTHRRVWGKSVWIFFFLFSGIRTETTTIVNFW